MLHPEKIFYKNEGKKKKKKKKKTKKGFRTPPRKFIKKTTL